MTEENKKVLIDGLEEGIKKYSKAIGTMKDDSSIVFDFPKRIIKVFYFDDTYWFTDTPKEDSSWAMVETAKADSYAYLVTELYEASVEV